MDKYSFKKYEGFNSRSTAKTMTITKNNSIGIASAFAEANGLDKYRYAVLYFDPSSNSIGIKFTSDQKERAKFALSRAQVGKGSSIIAHSFFKKNEINTKNYAGKKYLPKKMSLRNDLGIDEIGYIYVIDLDRPTDGDGV